MKAGLNTESLNALGKATSADLRDISKGCIALPPAGTVNVAPAKTLSAKVA